MPEPAPLQEETEQDSSQLKILLAEDNLVNQRLTLRLLQKIGHHVAAAQTGREVLDTLRSEKLIWFWWTCGARDERRP